MFVNRDEELRQLNAWWKSPGSHFGLVWGRRRVGKSLLLEEFSKELPTVFYTARGADRQAELAELSRQSSGLVELPYRALSSSPFRDWQDALETLAAASAAKQLLLIIDEFPELRAVEPGIEGLLRAFWDRIVAGPRSGLRILLCGSAVRTMEDIQTARAPLYGRFDLKMQVRPFRPHETALMLRHLKPPERARVWGITGGVPAYLSWWDQSHSLRQNLKRLVCSPGGLLLEEGAALLETEASGSGFTRPILYAVATGKNRFGEIQGSIQASQGQIARVLGNLEQLGLIERQVPVTEDVRKSFGGRTSYVIADNFLAFWLGLVARFRSEVERGLGEGILGAILQGFDEHMGARYEEAFRDHLRRLAAKGELGEQVVAVGRFWRRAAADPAEIDAVVLAGRSREAVLAGEAKWTRTVNAHTIRRELERKATLLPRRREPLLYAVCAREIVTQPQDVLAITAKDIFWNQSP